MLKIRNSAHSHFTRYIHRFHPQKSSAFYPFQHPHVRILPLAVISEILSESELATGPSRRNRKQSYRSVSWNKYAFCIPVQCMWCHINMSHTSDSITVITSVTVLFHLPGVGLLYTYPLPNENNFYL